MRKRSMWVGILGLSAALYSNDPVFFEEENQEALQESVSFARPQKKSVAPAPAELLIQEEVASLPDMAEEEGAVAEPALPKRVKKVKKRVVAQSQEAALPEASLDQKNQVVVVEEKRAAEPNPAKRVREQPVASSPAATQQIVKPETKSVEMSQAAARPAGPAAPKSPVASSPASTQQMAQPQKKGAEQASSVARPAAPKSPIAASHPKKVKKVAKAPLSKKVQSQQKSLEKIALADEGMAGSRNASPATVPAQATVITTPTSPIVKDNDNIFISLEYLIMTTSEGGLSYARQNTSGVNDCYDADFEWNSGFRFGTGYNMGHDRWDLQMVWTWLLTRGHQTKTDAVDRLYATNAAPSTSQEDGVLADTFHSHLNLHMNLLDTKIGREFFVSKWLTLHPNAGVRFGWVNQHWLTTAKGNVEALGTSLTEYKIDMKQKFWGVGPMLGLDTEWGLVSNFNLYANGSIALLTGFFNDYRNDIGVQGEGEADLTNPFRRRSHQPQWVSEVQLGLRWNQWMCGNRYRLVLQAGWDAIFFNDHNHFFGLTEGDQQLIDAHGDLMSQGVSMGLRFDF